jgi:hypothetical protein
VAPACFAGQALGRVLERIKRPGSLRLYLALPCNRFLRGRLPVLITGEPAPEPDQGYNKDQSAYS